ncbi:hypothetical protein Pyn_10453 [Prunus yedoensis var. nudiflora]|uniref:Uncharacterized protein n=1 Tax=Prunus yedoensis var. nudiflora TaxID=2094558 RepID=A0A314ZGX3_PRUYE|nr:hypothetical protein Pyn_10453 [Prunus yedoensis var. nudiflora]
MTEREGGVEGGSNLQVSPIVLLNSLRVLPPEDPLGEDAIEQPVLEVIKVFMDVFSTEPSEIFINTSLVHGAQVPFEMTCVMLDEFNFELAYMSTRHKDFEERFDELMANVAQSVSSA